MKEQWFLLGDIHGDITPIKNFYENNKTRLNLDITTNYMILLGDVGANFALQGNCDSSFKNKLSNYPFTYICLRGNHEARVTNVMKDNPESWDTKKKYGGKIFVEKQYTNIEYLMDSMAVYEFSVYKTLCIPGAYSIDKWYRINHGWPWFEDEQLSEEEMNKGKLLIKKEKTFDLVISHTCPLLYEPTDLFIRGVDQSQVDKTMERYLGELESNLNYKRWAFGHYHADRLYPWNEGKQMLMLFNENVVSLEKFMKMSRNYTLEDILA